MLHRHSRRCGTDPQHHHSGHIGQPAKPQRHIPNQTQPAVFWRACLRARRMHCESARPAGGFWRGMPTPSLPPKRALAPRLACALNRPLIVRFVQTAQPASAGAA
ncbi:hypothetical protein J4730_08350 [Klebsiella pneumoniae]|uniref:Uncharacterized protein n=1 Tax=Klebsiella pneumoniae TaxID=573 RepID=A0A939SQC8_KLEPN|nr:hypothetical protein [Klebsiella pneumoniae]